MLFSIIIPVYNRPQEIDELLESLTRQTYQNFETLIIEDGSEDRCEHIVKKYNKRLDIRYYYKENSGQGFSRNYGFERANGEYLIVFDSDCIIPSHYLQTVNEHLQQQPLDAFGGPDRAHQSFTPIQKAISYVMTSPFTTGGIRGNRKHAGTFNPRSFNMGISKRVFEATGGYKITRMGEDIEFSIRIKKHGFTTGLIPNAYVYHKRRTSLKQFYSQLHFFGRARINISRFHPGEVKFIHTLPFLFTLGLVGYLTLPFWNMDLFKWLTIPLAVFLLLIFTHAAYRNKNLWIGTLSSIAALIQLIAYGNGFFKELWRKLTERI